MTTIEPTSAMARARRALAPWAGPRRQPGPSNLLAVSIGHGTIDIFNSMGPVLLAHLQLVMGLSAAQVGLAVGLYQLLAGATQPLFGWWTDRQGLPRLSAWSVGWVLVLVVLSANLAPTIGFAAFVGLFAIAALGSGAFHPQGTMHAGIALPGRASTTTAIFFFCGQVGLSLGPFLAGWVIDGQGLEGLYWLALLFAPVPLWMGMRLLPAAGLEVDRRVPGAGMGGTESSEPKPRESVAGASSRRGSADAGSAEGVSDGPEAASSSSNGWSWPVALLTVVFSLRAWIFIGTASFLPLLFQAGGASATRQGLLTGAFWLGGGFSGVIAGVLADRIGKRLVAAICTGFGALLLLALPDVSGVWALAVVLLCGALLGAPHSVLMVIAQEVLPVRRGLAAGYALGFLFSMGAVASWCIGLLADQYALESVIRAGAVPGILVALLLLLLPASTSANPVESRS